MADTIKVAPSLPDAEHKSPQEHIEHEYCKGDIYWNSHILFSPIFHCLLFDLLKGSRPRGVGTRGLPLLGFANFIPSHSGLKH